MADRPKMCGNCGKLMGTGKECPYCGADNSKLGVKLKRAAVSTRRDASGLTVTIVIVGINVFLFLVALAVGGVQSPAGGLEILSPDTEIIWKLGLQDNAAVAAGDWWRLVMPIFLHLGLLHVAFNCYILWVAGRWVEADFGPRLMFMLYMLAGIVGFVASYFADIPGAGASGAVSGLLGAVLVRRRLVDGNFKNPITIWVIQLIVLNVILGVAMPMINNVAHGGGFVTGGVLAFILTKVPLRKTGAVMIMVVTTAMGVVTIAAFVTMFLNLGDPSPLAAQSASVCVRNADAAVRPNGLSISQSAAEAALRCVRDLSFADDEETGLPAISTALSRAISARDGGDLAGEQTAIGDLRAGMNRFTDWIVGTYPGYFRRVSVDGP